MPLFLGLVSPDWRVYFLENDNEEVLTASLTLDALVDALQIGWALHGNLRRFMLATFQT